MSDRISGVIGTVAIASLAVVCCAGPFVVVALASLGVGGWLAVHGLWLLGGLGLLLAAATAVAVYRRRQAGAACAIDEPDAQVSRPTSGPSRPRGLRP